MKERLSIGKEKQRNVDDGSAEFLITVIATKAHKKYEGYARLIFDSISSLSN